ncbi:MAG TPA: glycosyltransferase family 1 protein [Acidimicrobiales bacterium]|nr:glycosyltransferase family 1 protein [Acidimicrobiales bacterium]
MRPTDRWRPSMARFADALATGLPLGFGVHPSPPPRQRWAAPPVLARRIGHPWTLWRTRADVFHIIDHSQAHMIKVLPADRAVVTCHDVILLQAAKDHRLPPPRSRWVARFAWTIRHLRRAAAVVCVSAATREALLAACAVPADRVRVVPMAVDPCFRPSTTDQAVLRSSFGVGSSHVVCHVSSGWAYKNVNTTLRVLAALRAGGLDATLLRAGAPLNPSERDLADCLGVASAVVDTGIITDAGLARLYAASDALVFPSFYEGFGLPVLEAMASGTPVVASDCPALVELTGGAALHAPADDVAGLTEALATVLTSAPERDRLRHAGLARARGFGWAQTLEAYAGIYRWVDAHARGGAAPRGTPRVTAPPPPPGR